MKSRAAFVLLVMITFSATSVLAQAVAPERSANAAAVSDVQFIARGIEYNKDLMFLSRKAIDRGTDAKIKELAPQMLEDHSAMLYSMQQLQTAGAGSASQSGSTEDKYRKEAAEISAKLSNVSGANFDSVWVANMLVVQQAKYDELTQAKETVTNPQLKMAITEAIPMMRKQVTQLKSLQKYLARVALQLRKEAAQQEKLRKAEQRER